MCTVDVARGLQARAQQLDTDGGGARRSARGHASSAAADSMAASEGSSSGRPPVAARQSKRTRVEAADAERAAAEAAAAEAAAAEAAAAEAAEAEAAAAEAAEAAAAAGSSSARGSRACAGDWSDDANPLRLDDDDGSDAWLKWRRQCVQNYWLESDYKHFDFFITKVLPEELVDGVAQDLTDFMDEIFDDSGYHRKLTLDSDHREYITQAHFDLRTAKDPALEDDEWEAFFRFVAESVIRAARQWRDGQPERDAIAAQRAAEQLERSQLEQPQVGSRRGGKFLPLNIKGCPAKELVCADRLAPPHELTPSAEGYVPYRHDTLLLRTLFGMTNCLLEAMMSATGMGITELGVNRSALDEYMDKWHINPCDGPSMGVLDKVLQAARSPFRLPNCRELNANLKWTRLLNLTEGVYLVLALAWDDNKHVGHFVVFDSWRDLLIVGPKWGAVRVDPEDKDDESRARSFLLENYQLITPLQVCKLVVAANRISETKFNTPAHYADLEAKRAAKRDARAGGSSGGSGTQRALS